MDECDAKVADEDGFLAIMKERLWINRVARENCFQPLHPETGPVDFEEAHFSARILPA